MNHPETAPAGKELLVFDDGLASRDGHWFEYARAVATIHAERGARTTIVAHADFPYADELAKAGARVLPLIGASSWTGWNPTRRLPRLPAALRKMLVPWLEYEGHLQQARAHAAVLERVLAGQAYDCVLHPTALPADFLAWGLLPARVRQRAQRVVFSTWQPLGTYSAAGPPAFARKLVYWKWIARRLRSKFASGRMALKVDSPRLAEEYRRIAGLEAGPMPSPRSIVAPKADDAPRADAPLTFGAIGAARWEKGIDLFEAAIEALIAQGRAGDLRFVIHRNREVRMPDGSPLPPARALAASGQVAFIERELTSAEYDRTLREIDCMVLPYRREMYHSRSSAVAIEAACAAIPMIYTADTWLSDFVAGQGAGIAVADGDAAGLANAIRAMADDLAAFRIKAAERAAIARERNSPARFLAALWGLPQ